MTDLQSFAPWSVRRYGSVTSTMDVAAELIATGQVAGPTVVVADDQTAGRGRADRTWRSEPGGSLQMTAILSIPAPAASLRPLPLLIGVAVAESLEALDSGLALTLKWPNDVLLDGRKVAGILVVSRSDGQTTQLQIGIGVNFVEPDDPGTTAAGLNRLVGTSPSRDDLERLRDQLLGQILSRLLTLPGEMAQDGGAAGLARWSRRASHLGQQVRIVDGTRTHHGVLLGVDQTGALRLRSDEGQITTIVAGDLTRGPGPVSNSVLGTIT